MISNSCMKLGFEPANRHSIDSTKAAITQTKGTITETLILTSTYVAQGTSFCYTPRERARWL